MLSPAGSPLSRRSLLQAGSIGLLGLSLPRLEALTASREKDAGAARSPRARSVIYVFLSGGLSQIDSLDMKPDGPSKYRGPFRPISTATDGIQICEHLPRLARLSEKWALCRSLSHPFNEHSQGHMVMLSGRSDLPPGFDLNRPKPTDWPSIAAIAQQKLRGGGALLPTVVLPEKLVHRTGRVIPGQDGGRMGHGSDPWYYEVSRFTDKTYGAFPAYNFHHQRGAEARAQAAFETPALELPEGLSENRFRRRLEVLESIRSQQGHLERQRAVGQYRRYHRLALDLLTDPTTRDAFDIARASDDERRRYGDHSFGWSLLTARRLVESGVRLVQVNLGNNETWDTHVNAFPNLERFLFPPTDQALSALLTDLDTRGLLEETLVVVAGEFGRTPRIFSIGKGRPPGRDHWGAVQTVLLAGGGVRGGTVIGSSDADGGQPRDEPQKPENLASTIYEALGIPRDAHWEERGGRPHPIYREEPIPGLT